MNRPNTTSAPSPAAFSLTLEPLTRDNLPEAMSIDRTDIPEEWVDTAETIMEINDYGLENRLIGHTFLARRDGIAVGLIMVGEALPWDTDPEEMRGVPFYRVMGFVVDKSCRGKGLGGLILEKAIAEVYRDFGRRPLALGVHRDNRRAAKFYEKQGFRKTGVLEGEDEYWLRLI